MISLKPPTSPRGETLYGWMVFILLVLATCFAFLLKPIPTLKAIRAHRRRHKAATPAGAQS